MKLVCLIFPGCPQRDRWRFIFSPFPSPDMLMKCPPISDWREMYGRGIIGVIAAVAWIPVYRELDLLIPSNEMLRGYLAAPLIWFLGYPLLAVANVIWLPTKSLLPPVHNGPPLMRSVADFWGNRWNLWFSSWFRWTILKPFRKRPGLAVLLAFFVSGAMHEFVINLPLYLVTGRVLIGSMMIYFMLNGLGLLIEKRFLQKCGRVRIVFAWLVVLGPVPLLANEGLLRVMLLWD